MSTLGKERATTTLVVSAETERSSQTTLDRKGKRNDSSYNNCCFIEDGDQWSEAVGCG